MKRVCIIGVGQLGSRYLQGLSSCDEKLEIFAVEPSASARSIARKRWDEVAGQDMAHKLFFFNSIHEVKEDIDLAIVSTSADVRLQAIEIALNSFKVQYWILEKVLAQSEYELTRIESVLGQAKGAWVNTPRRVMKLYSNVIEKIRKDNPRIIKIDGGGWGLACNAIHFIDLAHFIFQDKLTCIGVEKLCNSWVAAKRINYFEVTGGLEVEFANNKELHINCSKDQSPIFIEIETENGLWTIDESAGIVKSSDGIIFKGNLEHQSAMTSKIVNEILRIGKCPLPTLHQSVSLHIPLIRALLAHWNKNMKQNAWKVPVT
jgi:predicted dehydrogenase